MRFLPDQPPTPVKSEFFDGDDIDDIDLDDITGLAHWLAARRGTHAQGPTFPESAPWVTTSDTLTPTDDGGGRLDAFPTYLWGRRGLDLHENWSGDKLVIVEIRGKDLIVSMDWYGFEAGDERQSPEPGATTTLTCQAKDWYRGVWAVDAREDVAAIDWTAKRRTVDGAAGEWYDTLVYEIPLVNQSTYLADLQVFGSGWVGHYADGATLGAWGGDEAAESLSQAAGNPTVNRGAVNTGASQGPPVHSVDFDGVGDEVATDGFVLGDPDGLVFSHWIFWTAAGGVAIKAGSGVFEASIVAGPAYEAALQTTLGTYTVSSTNATASTTEDWTTTWSKSDDELRLYKNGQLEDATATTGNLANDTTGKFFLGVNNDGHLTGQIALPCLLTADLSDHDLRRYLGWRQHVTALGPSLAVP